MSTVKTQTFADQVGPSVTFSNLSVTETGTGRYFSFLDSPTRTLATSFSAPYDQIEWRSFLGGAAGPGSSINLTFSYDVRSNVPGYGISSLQQSFTQNTAAGAVSLTVSEMVYDQDNNLVGTTSTRLGQVQDPMSTGYAPGGLALGTTYASLRVVVSLTASVADTAVSRALITFSQFEQGFQLSPHLVQAGDASFTTTLYTDADADGVRGANEAGLAGVTVQLLDGKGRPTGQTAVTDADGVASFTGLLPGNYQVAVVNPAGTNVSQSVNIGTPITLAAGQAAAATQGLYVPVTFTTRVYTDADASGAQDGTETGLAGVTVELLTGTGVPTGRTAVTDAQGDVTFAGLVPGSYQVAVIEPGGTVTGQKSNVDTVITLASGQAAVAVEGVYVPASLSGRVFADQNADGVSLVGDASLSGIIVLLLDSSGVPTGRSTLTDADGAYRFTGLVPGAYSVQVVAPAGSSFSPAGTSLDPALASIVNGTGVTAAVTLRSGQDALNQNAGLYVPATITAAVYLDTDGDGARGDTEAGLSGIAVQLLNADGTPTGRTALTDAQGNASFSGLAPGSYQVAVTEPDGTVTGQKTNMDTPITVLSGETAAAVQGVFVPASLGGRVFLDQNADGASLPGDASLAGVTVLLLTGAGVPTGVSAVTDADGAYLFTGVMPGSYSVQVVAPNGNSFSPAGPDSIVGAAGRTAPVTLASGQAVANQDAGVYAPATIVTRVYADSDADGVQDSNEAGLSGVTVQLLNADGIPTGRTAVTDGQGDVTFAGLVPGSYQVAVTEPDGAVVSTKRNVDAAVTLVSGQAAETVEGVYVPASLSGRVFLDQNADGVSLAGDTSLAGVTVLLLTGAGTPTGQSAVTDADGAYRFTGLVPGSYSVQVVAPAGNSFSPVGANPNPALDSIVNAAGRTAPVTLSSGQAVSNQNAGVYAPATVTTTIYADTNANGTRDGSEAGLAGVTVQLLNADGTPTGRTTVTDSRGNVSFTGLAPGSYQVAVVRTDGQAGSQNASVGTRVNVVSGQTTEAVQGVYVPASLGGRVFLDRNADGVSLAGDASLSGITVQLLDGAGNPTGRSMVTDADGAYLFTGLVPGTYSVQVVAPAGNSFSPVGVNPDPALDSIVNAAGRTAPVTLASGQIVANQNAGLYMPATITTTVYGDSDADGVRDGNEAGTPGITVQLLNADGTPTGRTTVTDAQGNATFSGLKPGSYQVAVVEAAGQAVSQKVNVDTAVTVLSGQAVAAVEGVYVPASLSGRVFLDKNADGVQMAGDGHAAGVTVQLLNASGQPTGRTDVTDSNGLYSFENLAPGTYSVQVVAPAGSSFSPVGVNPNPALGSIVNAAGRTAPVTLVSGQAVANQNAGLYAPATITVNVYSDFDRDHTRDSNDTGLSGVTVQLLNGNGAPTGRTAVTDAQGNVSFTGLVPGSYQVAVVEPTGTIVGQRSNVDTVLTLASGQTVAAVEGFKATGSLSGRVFLDKNADGVQLAGDGHAAGVTVQLLNGSGQATGRTDVTDSNGLYSFENLAPGTYSVQVVAPAGNSFSPPGANPDRALDSVVNAAGRTTPVAVGATHVPNQNAGLYVPATITVNIYADFDRDHTRDSNEGGLSGVTVQLLNGNGTATGRTAMTDVHGNVTFAGLVPGSYQVAVVEPNGTVVGQKSNVDTVLTLASGQTVAAVEGFKVTGTASIEVDKFASSMVVDEGCPVTYTFNVTNTGTRALTDVVLTDNVGTAARPEFLNPSAVKRSGTSYNLGDANSNNLLDAGETWKYQSRFTEDCAPYDMSAVSNVKVTAATAHNTSTTPKVTVSATDMENIQVQDGNCITVGGSRPTGELEHLYGKASKLEFVYNPKDTVSASALSAGIGTSSGHNADQMAFIVLTNTADVFDSASRFFFKGSVAAGGKLYADATYDIGGNELAGSINQFDSSTGKLYGHIFANQNDYLAGRDDLQDITFDATGAKGMYLGQQVGSLELIGYVGTSGRGYLAA